MIAPRAGAPPPANPAGIGENSVPQHGLRQVGDAATSSCTQLGEVAIEHLEIVDCLVSGERGPEDTANRSKVQVSFAGRP